jgi:hypothetical protein
MRKYGVFDVERIQLVERLLGRFMRRTERKHARTVDQDIEVAVSKLDGFFATARALEAS